MRKNYVKPITSLQEIQNMPFMATSNLVYDEEDPIFAAVIEDCFMVEVNINGTSKKDGVTNEEIKGYFTNTGNTSVCLQTDVLSTCQASGLKNKTNYKVSYNALKGEFVISDEGCTGRTHTLTYNTTNNN